MNNFIFDWLFLTKSQGSFSKEEGAISPFFGRRLLGFDICTCSYYFDIPASQIESDLPRPRLLQHVVIREILQPCVTPRGNLPYLHFTFASCILTSRAIPLSFTFR